MTSGSRQPTGLRIRPTAALVRAAVIGGASLALSLALGRPELILVGMPMLAWALVSLARRVLRGEELAVVDPQLRISRRSIEEGGTAAVVVQTAPGVLTTASLPMPPHAELAPRHGSLAGDGEVALRVSAQRWGQLRVGPLHVLVADALGARRAQRTLPPAEVQVVPASTVLDAPVEVPTPIGVSGAHLSRRRGDGTALSEVRAFRPGDRLHRINWRVSSRTRELHTNATFTEQDTEVLIVTDTIADVAPAPWAAAGDPTSLDMTIRATAAIARHYLTAGDRVSVFDIGHLIGPVPPGSGPRQLRVLTAALSRAGRDDSALRPVRRLRSVRPGTLAVVCTPLLSRDAIAQIGVLVAHGADVIVVDTLPPSIGDVSVLRGRPLPVDGKVSPRFWPEAWAMRRLLRERTVRELREAGVPITVWEGPSSLAPVLLSLSAARSAPRRRRS
ncbi:DUF58 domain-containing protein [Brachybacterium vulturis]|uniref:DUF58 domain-containing protein n=1 Tax=Brachybacterium vulturis TaxID=2017484 RepID=A0A291GRB9_9MICO|nr:DUF58 domain-containing protein [Brachybacterium vulturis]ATG52737.1 DUF58 domain-containing protein [Brachybacterium vulturis]